MANFPMLNRLEWEYTVNSVLEGYSSDPLSPAVVGFTTVDYVTPPKPKPWKPAIHKDVDSRICDVGEMWED